MLIGKRRGLKAKALVHTNIYKWNWQWIQQKRWRRSPLRGGANRKFKPNPRPRAPGEYAVVAEEQSVHGSLKEPMEPTIGIRRP